MNGQRIAVEVEKEAVFYGSEIYFRKICGYGEKETGELIEEAWKIRKKYEKKLVPRLCLFVKTESLVSYAMGIQEIKMEEEDLLEQFYLDCWMTAILDSTRDWLQQYLKGYFTKERGREMYVSPAFGPGFYDIPLERIAEIMRETGGEDQGIHWNGKALYPPKSNAGYYRITEQEEYWKERDCKSCFSGHKNCNFCKSYPTYK